MLPLPPRCKRGALLIELHPHSLTLCVKTDKAFATPNSVCIVEPAALYTLSVGFFLGPVTRFHILAHAQAS